MKSLILDQIKAFRRKFFLSEDRETVHFIGVGGVGMTGLALILRDWGCSVSGSDVLDSPNLALLRQHGVTVRVGHHQTAIKDAALVVRSSAVPADNAEWTAARKAGIPVWRRGKFLAELATCFPRCVTVAGSHGKTSVTAMLVHILLEQGLDPGYLVGGRVVNRACQAAAGNGRILVCEVDESDGTQAEMRSSLAIVTGVEDDHCWNLGGEAALQDCFRVFASRAEQILTPDTPELRTLFSDHPQSRFLDMRDAEAITELPIPGGHNRFNAWLAVQAAVQLGVEEADARQTLRSFYGVDRRLSLRRKGAVLVVEDYAHHPTEVRATLQAIREAWPNHRLRVVFQPHRHERVRRYAAAFAAELETADSVHILPAFGAWLVDKDPAADPRNIVRQIRQIPAQFTDVPYADLATALAAESRPGDLIAVLGAGSITHLIPQLDIALSRHRQ